MTNLSTVYMGLQLRSPIIVSSSGLTSSVEKIKQMAQHGAGAVVLKSLFEEQMLHEVSSMLQPGQWSSAQDYLQTYVEDSNMQNYLNLIQEAKAAVDIPIIASINCVSATDWAEYAADIEKAGANAIELNVHILPLDVHKPASFYEAKYFEIVRQVKAQVSIPVAVKIGKNFTNLLYFADQMVANGASALVLFNRFYEIDIDPNELKFGSCSVFSRPESMRHSLRWVGLMSERVKKLELSASTGVHNGQTAVKLLLAGAQTVQVCSVLYQKGIEELGTIHRELREWMERNGHETIGSFRGSMNYSTLNNPAVYERSQFMKYFSSIE